MSKKGRIPHKIQLDKSDKTNVHLKVFPRDKDTYDIGFWISSLVFSVVATVSFLTSTATILNNIIIGLVLIVLFIRPLILSLLSLIVTTEILIGSDSIEIIKNGLFSTRRNKIGKDEILNFEFEKITVNSHPMNSYLGFKSILNSEEKKYLRIWDKYGLPNNFLQYHDEKVKKWIYDYLSQKIK